MQAQRRESTHNAYYIYRHVPESVLKEVQDRYELDFELFEYDPKPDGIYAGL
jgi:hypothetical protein